MLSTRSTNAANRCLRSPSAYSPRRAKSCQPACSSSASSWLNRRQRWRLFSQLEAELEHAGWQLFARRGEYADGDLKQRFAAFVDRVESIVLAYQAGYPAQMTRLDRDAVTQDGPGLPGRAPNPQVPDWHWP